MKSLDRANILPAFSVGPEFKEPADQALVPTVGTSDSI